MWAPTDSLASLWGTYRFTGKPFGHLQIHWQALLVVFWDHYRFTGKLQGVQNQPTKGNFFWVFFFEISDPPENNSGTTSAEPEVHSPCLIATHHLYPHTSMTFRPLPITTCS